MLYAEIPLQMGESLGIYNGIYIVATHTWLGQNELNMIKALL
jgi:hypothetical protein